MSDAIKRRKPFTQIRVAVQRCSIHGFVMLSITPVDKGGVVLHTGRRVLGAKCCGRWDIEIHSWRTTVGEFTTEIHEAAR